MRRFSKRRRIQNRFVGRKFHFDQNGFFGLLKVCTCFSISMVSMTSQLFFLRERHMIDKANHIRDLMLLTSHYLVHKNIFLENLDPTFALFAQIQVKYLKLLRFNFLNYEALLRVLNHAKRKRLVLLNAFIKITTLFCFLCLHE